MTGNDELIAIVGMAGLLPGAADLNGFWDNVRSAADCSSDPPPGRWPITPEKLLDPRLATPDRVPTLCGYYLPPFTPDLADMDLSAWPIDELDPVFHLALHVGNAAWRSAVTNGIDRKRCGVILGNIALPTEKTNAITLEVLGPQLGIFHPTTHTNRVNRHSTGLPAALIARGLGFGLGGYALDAACASSLYAVKLACDELKACRANAMIAGGIHRSDSMYTQMGFAQLRALSPTGRCSPFDASADGLVVGEGGCAFVLKRLSDALAHGDTIHGVIAGIGLSNDIEGNVLQPASEGQVRALRAAYRQAGWRPSDVQLIECHATGTPTGDAIEYESLRQLWKGESGKTVLGGVKSTVGHLLTGAGAAALAKVLLAIRHKTLPPTANFSQPSPKLDFERGPFCLLTQARPWESTGPRRAAINGFGFGGINAHLLVEEWTGEPGASATGGFAPVADGPGSPIAIAIVGLAAQSGSPIDSITLPVARFRIPPKELEEMLPQQTLMLKVAAEALDDCQSKPADGLTTSVYIGITLDPNTTNYSLRWLAGETDVSLKDEVHPALTANRTMGSLGSIAASRVARFLGAGGPSFAVCDEEVGGLRAIALAVEALRKGEINRALVGGVELSTDERLGGANDGAAAVVLKRLADSERDGDRVYSLVRNVQVVGQGETRPRLDVPALGVLKLVAGCDRFASEVIDVNGQSAFWIHNSADGPRTLTVEVGNAGGYGIRVECEEARRSLDENRLPDRARVERRDGLFLLSGNSPADLLAELASLETMAHGSPLSLARLWWLSRKLRTSGPIGLAFTAETAAELRQSIALAKSHLRGRPNDYIADGVFYSPTPIRGDVAFVYPGSGNHFADMGRELGLAFPHVLRRQMHENRLLQSQYHAEHVWGVEELDEMSPRDLLFAQVALGTLVSDLLASFGVTPQAVVPYSLGESAGLFGTRAWSGRDEMFRRMQNSSLFVTDLAGSFNAARRKWGLALDQPIDWSTSVVNASFDQVRAAIRPNDRVYIQIINTNDDCVIGGERTAVESVVCSLGVPFVEVRGVTISHCEVVEEVRGAYRALHLLPTQTPECVRYYSGAWGRAYDLNVESAADAITAAALGTIDFPRVVNAAYADGARIFIEIGPGASCTRMIDSILAGRPHKARAACASRRDSVAEFLRLLAHLHSEGVPVDLSVMYAEPEPIVIESSGPTITLPVGYLPRRVVRPRADIVPDVVVDEHQPPDDIANPSLTVRAPEIASPVVVLAETQRETMQAHEAFLRFATAVQGHFAQTVAWQTELMLGRQPIYNRTSNDIPRSLDFGQCMEFARGLVGNVLGTKFAEVDTFPTRVRLPDGPLQLVDRVVTIDGEPLSMTPGRVVTEHRVHEKRWYLEHSRIPACVAIEAGQADLFLSGFLGIDFKTRGLACYRLLDAAVTFHRELPKIGELIKYDIRIDQFFRQGDTNLFRFRFEGSVNGEPLLSMRDGCAGFFTTEELAAGKGIVHTSLDLKPMPGVKAEGWSPYVPLWVESLSDVQVDALRKGNLVAAFGPEFARANLTNPSKLPGGKLKLVDRVERIEPTGGRYGLGRIRCEADIHPDDWFLTCHFVDDQVMPGTLMYECCLHTLRVLLMRMGWVCEEGEAHFEPVLGVASKLKCRGQVIASTNTVTYEVSLKEIGFRPEPIVIADALMYADGKAIVEVTNISLRMTGMTRERLGEIWKPRGLAFDRDHVLEFAVGSPSEAFGDRYRPFDHDRFIARLPGPPFSFLDRVVRADNCDQWKLTPGAVIEAEYDVPRDAWYFAANRCDSMPYSVLNEIALQACGWTAAYLGAALTSTDDLAFRNLGGNATQLAAVRPDSGKLITRVKLTKVAPAAGMIIVAFDFEVFRGSERVYSGDTTFGFFTRTALGNQVGLTGVTLLVPSSSEGSDSSSVFPSDPPFPDDMLRMVDRVTWSSTTDGPKGHGAIEGRVIVNPDAWFFKAHFLNDPVWPGSLGLESLVQLMKVYAHRRWGTPANGWQAMVANHPHRWAYRGQIVPTANEVVVQSYLTEIDDSRRFLRADGLLAVDGRIIYQMTDFTLQG